ncbi:CCAAT/enhancer-binding protein zeta-like isoform X2 [Homalodisca vitripennis]|uniref:CCAAT/enhancer-binding protein zeta-like isoform X2 n=1 Tax=Homalodisca vitripennis TaxID=197043 RepID=UPI001EEB56C3|nr:CCAAT/enhancer-binding protein zeta-like isoform X2 [Homalodisca vitripennis]
MKEVKKRNKYLYKKVNKNENTIHEDEENTETSYMEPTNPKWYEEFPKEPVEFPECEESQIVALRSEAEMVLKREEEMYNKKAGRSGNHDKAWLRTVMSKGTASDRVAAYIVIIQDAPVYNLSALRNLVNMVKVSKKKECMTVMETLTELFHSDLLRPGRKLLKFEQHPLSMLQELTSGNAMSRKKYLSYWVFEDHLKNLYAQFVHSLDIVSKDTVDAHREKAVTAMYKLLSRNPEQEVVLLKNLVNKLGDPNQKVVSKVIYSLTQLLRVHPVMKQVVANEIERFLFRPNVGSRSQYYAICFLSQYLFSSDDTELAENIISIYFSFFKANIKKGDIDSRMMGALLMGVNRAYPFARLERHELSEHVDTLYKLVHVSTFNISVQTLCLLYQIVGNSTDRFYCALYKKLLDPHLATSAHQAMFINLVYKAMRQDTNTNRVRVFIKRLLQVCLNCPSQLACGLLYLISQLIAKRSQLLALITHKQQMFEESNDNNDADDEENYKDAPLDVELVKEAEANGKDDSDVDMKPEEKPKLKPGWFHCQNAASKVELKVYDSRARNPAHARGEHAAYEELTVLSTHFHPTVALFARNILDKQHIKYSGDPLQDFTLLRFLERFVFKNPKQLSADSVDKGPDPCLAQRRLYTASGPRTLAVTSDTFLQRGEDKVPVDELFLYRYLQTKKSGVKEKPVKEVKKEKDEEEEDAESDVESVASEEFNDMLDKMVGKVDDDLDFADDVGDRLKSNKKKSKTQQEPESDDEEDFSEDNDDVDEDEDEELTDLEDEEGSEAEAIDFGEEGEDFDGDIDLDNLGSEDEDDDFEEEMKTSKSKKNKFPKSSKGGIHTMFAPAEKFAEMLEETGASRLKVGTAHDVSNKDNAALKQLEWEAKRNHWAHGGGKRKQFNKGGGKPSFNKAKRKKY